MRWEYLVETYTNVTEEELTQQLNEHGQQGWVLFSIVSPKNKEWVCVYRRQL